MTVLNETGDTTIAWDQESDDTMRAFIEKKMSEGWSFFLIKPRQGGVLPPKRTKLKKIGDLKTDGRSVVVADSDFATLLQSGLVDSAGRGEGPIETTGRAKSANQAAEGLTVAVAPRRGG